MFNFKGKVLTQRGELKRQRRQRNKQKRIIRSIGGNQRITPIFIKKRDIQ